MDLARATAARRRWGWAAIAATAAAVVLDWAPIDDYFPLCAMAGAAFCLIERSFYSGWLAREKVAQDVEEFDRQRR